MQEAIEIVSDRIEHLGDEVERAETQYDNPECPHCGREMEWGGLEGGKTTFGCYPGFGPDRENYDCEFFQKHGYAYSIDRNLRDIAPLKRAKREMESVLRELERAASQSSTGNGEAAEAALEDLDE